MCVMCPNEEAKGYLNGLKVNGLYIVDGRTQARCRWILKNGSQQLFRLMDGRSSLDDVRNNERVELSKKESCVCFFWILLVGKSCI